MDSLTRDIITNAFKQGERRGERRGVVLGLCLGLVITLALVILGGCATGAVRQPTRAGERNGKLAVEVLTFASGRACDVRTLQCIPMTWDRSGWWRQDDMTLPDYVVLAGDGTACPIWRILVEPPQEQRYWQCAESWRIRRSLQ